MSKFINNVSNSMRTAGFQVRKYSPEIMIGVGIVSAIAGVIMACRATLKAKPVVEEHKKRIEAIHEAYDDPEINYSEQAKNKDVTKTYAYTGWQLIKLYSVPAALVTLSFASFLGSHKIMSDRNMETAAAAMAFSTMVKGYRERVAEKIGKDEEGALWIKPTREELMKAAEEAKADDDVKSKKRRNKKDPYKPGVYARIVDEACPFWDPNPEFTLWGLKAAESTANNLLETRRFLFLNDVYDILGFERTQQGSRVGWIYDPAILHKIDFGLYDMRDPMKARFLDGSEPNVIIDFNVDGVILNKLPKE